MIGLTIHKEYGYDYDDYHCSRHIITFDNVHKIHLDIGDNPLFCCIAFFVSLYAVL